MSTLHRSTEEVIRFSIRREPRFPRELISHRLIRAHERGDEGDPAWSQDAHRIAEGARDDVKHVLCLLVADLVDDAEDVLRGDGAEQRGVGAEDRWSERSSDHCSIDQHRSLHRVTEKHAIHEVSSADGWISASEECTRNRNKVQSQTKTTPLLESSGVVFGLDMLEEDRDEDRLPGEGEFERDIAMFAGKEVVKVEVESAELFERFCAEDIGESHEEIGQNASGDGGGKRDVCSVCPHKKDGHHHVHCNHGVDHDVGDGEFSLLFVDTEQICELVVAMGDHVDEKVRGGSQEESEDRIANCAANCSPNGCMGGKRHNGSMIAHLEFFGENVLEFGSRTPRWRNGIRDGLKIRFSQGIEGSSPSRGTKRKGMFSSAG